MREPTFAETIAAFRRFNRFYTRRIGVLRPRILDSRLSLAEARVLFELATRGVEDSTACASELRDELGLDPGYLSRILARFEREGLVSSAKAEGDGRRRLIKLEPKGQELFRELDSRSTDDATKALSSLDRGALLTLASAMRKIESILGGVQEPASIVIREPEPGDLGWVVSAHGEIYGREYGWGVELERIVARIIADFAAGHDPARERAWIAELDGERIGSIFLVKADEETAKLRLLILAQGARGRGLGKRLVDECLAFARSAGYRRVRLWTSDALTAARAIYAKAGFVLVSSKPETNFGQGAMSETWELSL